MPSIVTATASFLSRGPIDAARSSPVEPTGSSLVDPSGSRMITWDSIASSSSPDWSQANAEERSSRSDIVASQCVLIDGAQSAGSVEVIVETGSH